MRKRLRKKRHSAFLRDICGYVVAFDDELRQLLLKSDPGTPFPIDGRCNEEMQRLVRSYHLRYRITVARKLGPTTGIVVYWAEEFPSLRDEALIFSADDLGLSELLARKRQEHSLERVTQDAT
jgi:hypothetical protein